MNGKHTDPAYDLEWGQTQGDLQHLTRGRRRADRVVWSTIALVIAGLALVAFSSSEAEAARRVRAVQASSCSGPQCAVQQQVQHVVAAPVVHHAVEQVVVKEVVHAQPTIGTQNFWYQVGGQAALEAAAANAMRSVMAEQQFKANVSGTFQGSINGSAQGLYQQQTAPVQQQWQPPSQPQQQPQWTPPPEPQPPAEPDAPPTFSALDANCAGCHANGKAKGGFSFEGMTGDQFWAAVDRVRDGTMPPTNPLAESAKEAVVKELFTLKP
jgi:hypothetical protein